MPLGLPMLLCEHIRVRAHPWLEAERSCKLGGLPFLHSLAGRTVWACAPDGSRVPPERKTPCHSFSRSCPPHMRGVRPWPTLLDSCPALWSLPEMRQRANNSSPSLPRRALQFVPCQPAGRTSCTLDATGEIQIVRGPLGSAVCELKGCCCPCCSASRPAPSIFFVGALFSEENVYLLCKQLGRRRIARSDLSDLFVVFISNSSQKVPLSNHCSSLLYHSAMQWCCCYFELLWCCYL